MKDKTDSMNRDYGGAGEGGVNGYVKLPNSEMATRRDRKDRQLRWANLEDNKALMDFENYTNADNDWLMGGFLPRNNYEDRS